MYKSCVCVCVCVYKWCVEVVDGVCKSHETVRAVGGLSEASEV